MRALISVSNKTGIVGFSRELVSLGVEIVSTGGTATLLRNADLPVIDVSEKTGFPECLGGRLKTLHPAIFGGVLTRDTPKDRTELEPHRIQPFDLVIVNLYPFEQTVASPDCTLEGAIEMIDVGGPGLLRAAAKNHDRVTVVVDPDDLEDVLEQLRMTGTTSLATRRRLAAKAFAHTALYDIVIAQYLSVQWGCPIPELERYLTGNA